MKSRAEVISCTPPVAQGCWQSPGTTRLATLPQLPWAWTIDLTGQPADAADFSEHARPMTMLTCQFALELQMVVLLLLQFHVLSPCCLLGVWACAALLVCAAAPPPPRRRARLSPMQLAGCARVQSVGCRM